MNLKAIVLDFRSRVALTLFLIWILAIWHFRSLNVVLCPLLSVLTVTALDVLITYVRSKKIYYPGASFVSGFLVGLIIAPTEKWWVFVLAATVASLSKQFIGAGIRQHVFNPAAFGIMTVSLVFGVPVAWWAVSWSWWLLLILVPAMIRILWKMKRLWLPAMFLATYFLYLLTIFDAQTAIRTLIDGSVMLFALVMLPEPITSPAFGKFKYFFGPMVAILAISLSELTPLSEIFLPSLLIANLVGFMALRIKRIPK